MKELTQAGEFFNSLADGEVKDLAEAIAENIFFLDEDLQSEIIALMRRASPKLAEILERCNGIE